MIETQKQPSPEILSRRQAIEILKTIAAHEASESPEAFLNNLEIPQILGKLIDLHGTVDDPYLAFKKITSYDPTTTQSFEARVYPNLDQTPSVLHMWTWNHRDQMPVYGVSIPIKGDTSFDAGRPIVATWGGQPTVYDLSGNRTNKGPASLINTIVQQSAIRMADQIQGLPAGLQPDSSADILAA